MHTQNCWTFNLEFSLNVLNFDYTKFLLSKDDFKKESESLFTQKVYIKANHASIFSVDGQTKFLLKMFRKYFTLKHTHIYNHIFSAIFQFVICFSHMNPNILRIALYHTGVVLRM